MILIKGSAYAVLFLSNMLLEISNDHDTRKENGSASRIQKCSCISSMLSLYYKSRIVGFRVVYVKLFFSMNPTQPYMKYSQRKKPKTLNLGLFSKTVNENGMIFKDLHPEPTDPKFYWILFNSSLYILIWIKRVFFIRPTLFSRH